MGRTTAVIIVLMLSLGPTQAWDVVESPTSHAIPGGLNPQVDHQIAIDRQQMLSDIPGHFTENRGQLNDESILLYCLGDPLSVGFGVGMVTYDYQPSHGDIGVRFDVRFEGANEVRPIGQKEMLHNNNYFIGNDSTKWTTGARNFRAVLFRDLYDGIDLKFVFSGSSLKYEFQVAPGAEPSEIIMSYFGINEIETDGETGDLLIQTSVGRLRDERPLSIQAVKGSMKRVTSEYRLLSRTEVTFQIDSYDDSIPLTIDPGLEFSTFIGGSRGDGTFTYYQGISTFVDDDMDMYLASRTYSADFPVTIGAYCTTRTNDGGVDRKGDVFVAKLKHDGSALLFATYIGGNRLDEGLDIAVDDEGNSYVIGGTVSTDFPTTTGAISSTYSGNGDCFILKLNSSGSSLLYSTYLGGSSYDPFWDQLGSLSLYSDFAFISVDGSGNLIVSGVTQSTDFPMVSGGFDSSPNKGDIFVLKIDKDLSRITHGTFIGGKEGEVIYDMEIDDEGYIYLTGSTTSSDFPVTGGAYQRQLGGYLDGIIVKIEPDLSDLVFSTYIGKYDNEVMESLTLDPKGNVIASGFTLNDDFPTTPGAYMSNRESHGNPVLVKLNASGDRLIFSTFLPGGETNDHSLGSEVAIDDDGNIIFGTTTSSDSLPITTHGVPGAHSGGYYDIYIGCIDRTGSALLYGAYLGGSENEMISDLQLLDGNLTIVGTTISSDFPTTKGAFCETYNTDTGGFDKGDTFVTRLKIDLVNLYPPSSPLNLTTIVDYQMVGLTWDPPESDGNQSILGYKVYKGLIPDSLFVETVTPPTIRQFIDRNVVNGQTYYYSVSAYNWYGEGNRTEVVNATPYKRPTADLNFTGTPGCTTVLLTWDPPSDTGGHPVLGYRLYRGTSLLEIPHLLDLGNVTYHTDTNLTKGVTYYYQLRAFTEVMEGHMTDRLVITPVGPPDAPSLGIARGLDKAISLNWVPPTNDGGRDILGYVIMRGDGDGPLLVIDTVDAYTTFYLDENLTNGVTYYYAVYAYNELGPGPLSRTVSTFPFGPPGPPFSPFAIVGDGYVYLDWERPLDDGGDVTVHYLIYRTSDNGTYEVLWELFETNYTDTDVENGVTYQYIITAWNYLYEGPGTKVIYATPMTVPDAPTRPGLVSGARFIELTWNAPDDTGGAPITRYNIYRGESPDTITYLDWVGPTLTRYIDDTVADGQEYFYQISAVTPAGEGPLSDIISGTALGPPESPLDLTAIPGDGEVTLSWSPPPFDGGREVWGYVILRGDTDLDLPEVAKVGVTLTYTDTSVENGRTYYYRVAAYNSIGTGPGSNIVDATPFSLRTVPGVPRALHAVGDGGTVVLTWSPPELDGGSPLLGYTVLRGSSSDDLEVVRDVGLSLSYIDGQVDRGTTYHYSVVARNLIGEGEPADTVDIELRVQEEASPPLPVAFPWLLVIVLVAAVAYGTASISTTESGRYRWGLLLGPLTTRLKRDEVLDNKTRFALHGMIREHPGIHYNALMREFDLKNGAAAYHLSVLEKEAYVRSVRDGRLKRFYPTEVKVPDDFRLTPEEIKKTILEMVTSNPGISQKEIVDELDLKDITVRYHLRAMVADGTLRDSKDGRLTIYHRNA